MNYEMQAVVLSDKIEIDSFFKWCLKKKLYKDDEVNSNGELTFVSRMKKVYEHVKAMEYTGVIAAIAMKDEKPIGIALFEYAPEIFDSEIVERNHRVKSGYKIIKTIDSKSVTLGFMSLYVKPSNRGKGLAKDLAQTLEELVIENAIKDGYLNKEKEDIPLIQCAELAYEIANKYFVWTYPIKSSNNSYNFKYEVSNIVHFIDEVRHGEIYPLYERMVSERSDISYFTKSEDNQECKSYLLKNK